MQQISPYSNPLIDNLGGLSSSQPIHESHSINLPIAKLNVSAARNANFLLITRQQRAGVAWDIPASVNLSRELLNLASLSELFSHFF
jgi:hypothetical protein